MTREDLQNTIDSLDDLLDAERAALLKGNLEDVARLLERKEGLIDALNRIEFKERSDFEGLQAKVERNQALLDSALDGVRSVARRLAAIRRVRQSLDTYDSFGKKRTVDVRSNGSVEKRA
ncbi:flagellar biosynthesis protein FlgN [Tateyamaria sp. SN3-11]|uniref:flagellar biosynthesis protein FlgN n=1 Tax=Tateyamaria sp. SN3-11 TaxID=3092147 RepID=UPI0039ED6210